METDTKKIYDLLHLSSEWSKIARGKRGFYRYKITRKNQVAYFFGTNHSRDPHDEQYSQLKEFWSEFVQESTGKSPVVIMEGGVRRVHSSEEEAIHRDSEGGMIAYLAHPLGITLQSAEPPLQSVLSSLLKTFTKDEIAYYYFIRVVHQWMNLPSSRIPIEEYLEKDLIRNQISFNWRDFDFSLQHMKNLHLQYFGSDFDLDIKSKSKEYFLNLFISIKITTNINRIGVELAMLRNVYMVQVCAELWSQGKSIFAAFGNSHTILQERALRELLKGDE